MESTLSNRDILKSKKNKTDEELIELWDFNIQEIIATGNVSSDTRGSKMFPDSHDKKEMILYCLIRKLSIKDGIHYNLSFGNPHPTHPEMHLYHYIEQDGNRVYVVKDVVDLIAEVEMILAEKQ